MAKITVLLNGAVFGTPPTPNNKKKIVFERGETNGWTASSTRSLTKWLYGADVREFGDGIAFSFTVKDYPADASKWAAVRKRFILRLKRLGMTHFQWLTEWQLRGCPHLHGCVWVDNYQGDRTLALIEQAWLGASKEYGSEIWGQDIKPIRDFLGWKNYLSKHASRSAHNDQRSNVNMPKTWTKSGRMWGYWGEWPTFNLEFEICEKGGHAYRRIIKGWRLASSRSEIDPKKRKGRVRSAKKMFKSSIQNLSSVRGLSEWSDMEHTLKIIDHLKIRDFRIIH